MTSQEITLSDWIIDNRPGKVFSQDIEVPGKTPAWVHYYSCKHDKDFKVHWEDNETIEIEYRDYLPQRFFFQTLTHLKTLQNDNI